MFSCWQRKELAFVKNKKSVLQWHIKYNEHKFTQSDLQAETVAWAYKRYHKISTYPPKPYAFRFHGNSDCLPPGYCFAVYLSVLLYKQQIQISLFLQHKCMRLVTAGANRISLNPVRQVNDITSQVWNLRSLCL